MCRGERERGRKEDASEEDDTVAVCALVSNNRDSSTRPNDLPLT